MVPLTAIEDVIRQIGREGFHRKIWRAGAHTPLPADGRYAACVPSHLPSSKT